MNNKTLFKYLLALLFLPLTVVAQTITGTVKDESGEALPYANVVEQGTQNGTTTDDNGNFSLTVSKIPTTLVASFVGLGSQTKNITGTEQVAFTLSSSSKLDEVVITGSRGKPRTVLTSPVPIDYVDAKALVSSGQPTFDKMLSYKVPSFNSTNQTISDATAHFDPADLRGLGPSRTLVLVNGKRKNLSALVYVNDTPGKGEVGTDLKSIPTAAIANIEVLRDGASAQYGSDAIAGVINIILKKQVNKTTANITSGITSEGDGFNFGADVNSGFKLGEKGFFNYTLAFYNQDKTNRAGTPGEDNLFGVAANDPTYGAWLAAHPDLGMTVGQPKLTSTNLTINAGSPISKGKADFYATLSANTRKGTSYALYRTPYWITTDYGLLTPAGQTYDGFQPTFETGIKDYLATLGTKFKLAGFDSDLSLTYGSNAVDYTIGNTINPSMGAASPTTFDAGAYAFSQLVTNLNFNKTIGNFGIGFGTEIRQETFEAKAGQIESYQGGGAQSFPGLQPANALKKNRNNIGFFTTLEWDVNDTFLVGGSLRYENYSDFGNNVSWKLNSRYKLGDNGALRASYSTGFRAPALHQIYLSNIQTLVSGGTISNQGTFNNVDPVIRNGLGVPQLHAETANNFSIGYTQRIARNFSFSLDYYNVAIKDRVLFSGEVGYQAGGPGNPANNPVEQILDTYNVTSMKFFINAVNTKTSGLDLVANYSNIDFASGKLDINFSANFNKTKIDGQIATPQILASNGYDIFNRKEQSRIISARPDSKVLLGFDYKKNKLGVNFNNTYFGSVTWQHASDPTKDQTFKGKVLTDLGFTYAFSKKISANLMFNNLFNVYPDEIDTKGDVVTDLGGRFKYPWEVNQFGFNGTTVSGGVHFTF